MRQKTVVSAPGAVCLWGWCTGQKAAALPVSARLYVVITTNEVETDPGVLSLHVETPQFNETPSLYIAFPSQDTVEVLSNNANSNVNEYIHVTLYHILREVKGAIGGRRFRDCMREGRLDISIYVDEQFYSSKPVDTASIKVDLIGKKFRKWDSSIANTTRNGIGSSAALCAALSTALYIHMRVMKIDHRDYGLACIQATRAHQRCGRTNAHEVVASFLGPTAFQTLSVSTLRERVHHIGDAAAFALPPFTTVLIGIVDAESKVSFETTVRRWSQGKIAAGHTTIFREVVRSQEHILAGFQALLHIHEKDSVGYAEGIISISTTSSQDWTALTASSKVSAFVMRAITDIHYWNENIRSSLREIGTQAAIELEPPKMTAILDRTTTLKGVIAAGLTGAGGSSGIWALVCAPPIDYMAMAVSPIDGVANAWSSYPDLTVTSLAVACNQQDRVTVEYAS